MIILLAVVALVVVNALKALPWGTFTIAATMPIAMLMGVYLRYWRPGKVLEASLHRLRAGAGAPSSAGSGSRSRRSGRRVFTLTGPRAGASR